MADLPDTHSREGESYSCIYMYVHAEEEGEKAGEYVARELPKDDDDDGDGSRTRARERENAV